VKPEKKKKKCRPVPYFHGDTIPAHFIKRRMQCPYETRGFNFLIFCTVFFLLRSLFNVSFSAGWVLQHRKVERLWLMKRNDIDEAIAFCLEVLSCSSGELRKPTKKFSLSIQSLCVCVGL
jgi:hypothetical protein